MPEFIETIFARRSIRAYTERPVDRETLKLLLQAAMAAPSAANSQPWEFIVIDEIEALDGLRGQLRFGQYNAPAAIVVCGSPETAHNSAGRRFWVQDCSAAIENILIAAAGLGLGTVWIGVYPLPAVVQAVSQELGLPEQVIPLGVIYVGHPAEEKPPRTQYDEHRVYWQHYAPHKRRAKLKNAKHQ